MKYFVYFFFFIFSVMFFYFFLILFGFLCVFLYFLVCFFRVAWLECPKAVKVKSSRLEWPKAGSGPGSGGSGGSRVGSPGRLFLNSSLAHVINTRASTCSIHMC